MASESSLLGLMNQLQSLESSMAVILMESAMKISSLTDANIFLLVETSTGRRFCGAPHLCSAYARATLAPVGNDVEIEVNLASSGVSERRILTPSADRTAQRNTNVNDDTYQNFFEDSTEPEDDDHQSSSSGHPAINSHLNSSHPLTSSSNLFVNSSMNNKQKRRHPPSSTASTLHSFAPKRFQKDLANDVKIEMTEDLDAETGLLMTTRRGQDDNPLQNQGDHEDLLDGDCNDDDIICDNYLPTPLTNSGLQNSELSFPRQHLDAAVDDFMADIQPHEESALNNAQQNFYGQSSQWNQHSDTPFPMPPQFTNIFSSTHNATSRRGGSGFAGGGGGGGGRGRGKTSRPRSASTNQNRSLVPYTAPSPGQLNNVGGWDLAAFLSSNPKVQALQQIRDDSIAEKHSTSNRLLHSVLYTVGRAIAQNCAIKDKKAVEAKVFFNKIFELWWSQFPFLQELNSKGVKLQKGKKMLPLRGSVRETMQRYFGNTLDKVLQDLENKQRQHQLAISDQMQPLSSDSIQPIHSQNDSLHNHHVDMHLGLE